MTVSLPESPQDWTVEHDLVVFRRVQKLLEGAPPQAMARMRAYLIEIVENAGSSVPFVPTEQVR